MKLYLLYKNKDSTEQLISEYLKCPPEGEYFRDKIFSTANERLREDRILSRRLLCTVCEKELGRAPGEVVYNSYGKPCFADECASFSISHSERLILLAFEKGAPEIGADVQIEPVGDKLNRVCERFQGKFPKEFNSEPVRIDEITLCNVKASFLTMRRLDTDLTAVTELSVTDLRAEIPPLTAWTLTEAVLKAQGEGFGALCRARELSKDYSVASYTIVIGGKRYSISVAKKAD